MKPVLEGTDIHTMPIAHPGELRATADALAGARLCHRGALLAAVGRRLHRRQMGGARDAALGALLLAADARLRDPAADRAPSPRGDDRAGPLARARSAHHRRDRPDALPGHDLYRPQLHRRDDRRHHHGAVADHDDGACPLRARRAARPLEGARRAACARAAWW